MALNLFPLLRVHNITKNDLAFGQVPAWNSKHTCILHYLRQYVGWNAIQILRSVAELASAGVLEKLVFLNNVKVTAILTFSFSTRRGLLHCICAWIMQLPAVRCTRVE
jgi:hypothetical protein